jgi:hypothetical protein
VARRKGTVPALQAVASARRAPRRIPAPRRPRILTGRLQQRSLETSEGDKRTTIELDVDEIGASLKFTTLKITKPMASPPRLPPPSRPQTRSHRSDRPYGATGSHRGSRSRRPPPPLRSYEKLEIVWKFVVFIERSCVALVRTPRRTCADIDVGIERDIVRNASCLI